MMFETKDNRNDIEHHLKVKDKIITEFREHQISPGRIRTYDQTSQWRLYLGDKRSPSSTQASSWSRIDYPGSGP